ncbi:hypothetical protein FB451DRAFT_1404594 [Mycena latifolia]|nr:hypothetical protein FB451DRAFT_1404594 [Mycena latifolia]
MWLERAGGLPLSVKLDFELDEGFTSGVFSTFAKHSGRMQSLELEVYVKQLEALAEMVDDPWTFPLLQMLSLYFFDADDYDLRDDLEMPPIVIFTNSPLLCEVSISEPPPSFISLPWHQLSKFTGKAYSITDCLEVLRLIPNLTECTFSFDDYDDEADVTPLTHSNLLSLTLVVTETNVSDLNILQSLTLPALQTLQILHFPTNVFYDEPDVFIAFLSRSSPPLRKFTVRLEEVTEFETTLLRMPELVDLEIWNPTLFFIRRFFNLFGDCDTSFLPRLQRLAFLGCERPFEIMFLLWAGLANRWRARHRSEFAEL